MAGFLIGSLAFVLPLAFGLTGIARPRLVLVTGSVVGVGWLLSLAAVRSSDADGEPVVPLWFLAGLVLLLYAIWCGGLWLGVRLRKARIQRRAPG